MATFTAYYEMDFLAIDLNFYARNFWDAQFTDEWFGTVNGVVYEDLFYVNGYDDTTLLDLGLLMLGSGMALGPGGVLTEGRVFSLIEFYWEGDDIWMAEGIDIAASDVVRVALTADNGDDLALIQTALSGSDVMDLSDGGDRVSGFDGDDTIFGWFGNDFLYGGIGNDSIFGEADSDHLFGQDGSDLLEGGDGDDTIFGGAGEDWIVGGTGNDLVFGGSGADSFEFAVGDGILTIGDFEAGVDELAIAGLPLGFTVVNLLPFVSQDGGDVVIRAGAQEIRFVDTQLSELSAGDVAFV